MKAGATPLWRGLRWLKLAFYFLVMLMGSCVDLWSSSPIKGDLRILTSWIPGQEKCLHFPLRPNCAWMWGPDLEPPSCYQPEGEARTRSKETLGRVSRGVGSTQAGTGSISKLPGTPVNKVPYQLVYLSWVYFSFFFAESIRNDKCGDEVLRVYTLYIHFKSWEVYRHLRTRT